MQDHKKDNFFKLLNKDILNHLFTFFSPSALLNFSKTSQINNRDIVKSNTWKEKVGNINLKELINCEITTIGKKLFAEIGLVFVSFKSLDYPTGKIMDKECKIKTFADLEIENNRFKIRLWDNINGHSLINGFIQEQKAINPGYYNNDDLYYNNGADEEYFFFSEAASQYIKDCYLGKNYIPIKLKLSAIADTYLQDYPNVAQYINITKKGREHDNDNALEVLSLFIKENGKFKDRINFLFAVMMVLTSLLQDSKLIKEAKCINDEKILITMQNIQGIDFVKYLLGLIFDIPFESLCQNENYTLSINISDISLNILRINEYLNKDIFFIGGVCDYSDNVQKYVSNNNLPGAILLVKQDIPKTRNYKFSLLKVGARSDIENSSVLNRQEEIKIAFNDFKEYFRLKEQESEYLSIKP